MRRIKIKRPPYFCEERNVWVIPLTQGKEALIDECDLPEIGQYNWYYAVVTSRAKLARAGAIHGYAMCKRQKQTYYMHTEIGKCMVENFAYMDHADGNTLDNRRANLRPCSSTQNLANQRPKRGGTSMYKGVYVREGKTRKTYTAAIRSKPRRIHLGSFGTEIEAALAYDEAAVRLFGEFALTNFGEKGYFNAD